MSRLRNFKQLPLFLFCSSILSTGQAVQLSVDTDRNGEVLLEIDAEGHDKWTPTRGAFFLNNNDSDSGSKTPDNQDEIINGDQDLQDLAVIKLNQLSDFKEGSTITVTIDDESKGKVRLFLLNAEGTYSPLNLETKGNIDPALVLNRDGEIRIEAKTYASPAWDGKTEVTITSEGDGGETLTDTVQLHVAPFILLPSSAKGNVIYVREFPGRNDEMLAQMKEIATEAGAELFIIPGGKDSPYEYNHIWLQDALEIGYQGMPGKKMNVVLKANRNKSLDNFSKNELLGPDFGFVEWSQYRESHGRGDGGVEWMDWYGNLEVTPPYEGHPYGTIFYGITPEGDSLNPEIVAMLNAQQVQAPAVGLDVGWLQIKHVDEMVSFVPVDDQGNYKVMVPDNNLAIELLTKFKAEGHGDVEILQPFAQDGYVSKYPKVTSNAILEDAELLKFAANLQETRIEPMIAQITTEFKLKPEQIVRVPFLMESGRSALFPNMVNSLIVNGHLIIPDPCGPVVEGVDLMQQFMRDQFAGNAVTLHFVDDRQYHKWSGNVHCATNVRREVPEAWWSSLK